MYLLEKIQNNVCTVTGSNIAYVLRETDSDSIFTMKIKNVKKTLKFCEVMKEDNCKVDFAKEIVEVKQNILHIDNNLMKTSELDDILSFITSC